MTELNMVAKEIAKSLADLRQSAKDNPPHWEITDLYRKYFEDARRRDPQKGKIQIQNEFAQIGERSLAWAISYNRMLNLHPGILERVRVKSDPRLTFAVLQRLAGHPTHSQEAVLEKAQELCKDKPSNLWTHIEKISRKSREKKDYQNAVTSLQTAPQPPAEQKPAVRLTLVPKPKQVVVDDFDQRRQRDEEARMKQALEVASRRVVRRFDDVAPPTKKEPTKWLGGGKTNEGSKY